MSGSIYIMDADQDIDDYIAALYLYEKGVLRGIVLDPEPKEIVGQERVAQLKKLGIIFYSEIPSGTRIVFNGGAFTKIAEYLNRDVLKILVTNGGFIPDSVYPVCAKKFTGFKDCRSYNPNLDATAAEIVLITKQDRIGETLMISKNVCHHEKNTRKGIWKDFSLNYFDMMSVKEEKRLHDLLMVTEGMARFQYLSTKMLYIPVKIHHSGLKGNMTKWSATISDMMTSSIAAAVDFLPL